MDHYHWKQNLGESFGEGLMVKGNRDHGRKKDKDNISARGHSRSKSKSKTVKYYKFQKKGHMLRVCLLWKIYKDKDKEGSSKSVNVVAIDADSN